MAAEGAGGQWLVFASGSGLALCRATIGILSVFAGLQRFGQGPGSLMSSWPDSLVSRFWFWEG
ncbi:hypothetical protein N657DRAFT_642109 [Parathielavia appendiculata]|uniref:Uncharacterized protein n=1 Tax=Parathielavia appendiculata TaxID=2587402 RepID=A0AAN6U2U2_9PEZI|nr:hypothetical protein N657DRAFT_642109 [Parathielavia appendiculata]